MNFLRNILKTKDTPIKSYVDFWSWFQRHEKEFFKVVKKGDHIESAFFDKLSPKLEELKDGILYAAGMCDDHTAELAFTVDGAIKNIAFVEELVAAAPATDGWKFTALKPPMGMEGFTISMAGYEFSSKNIHFYSNEDAQHPDEIDITVVHDDYNEEDKTDIVNGTFIYLDNLLGELNFATMIDSIEVVGKENVTQELIPIEKLKSYLIWREKEFIEKHEGTRHDTENDEYSILEADLENGNKLLAVINTDLLEWDSKASHPWILYVEIKYDGSDNNGMPDDETFQLLGKIEEEITEQLKDSDGYLNIGRQTADSLRTIYFACNDFRKPSKVLHEVQVKYAEQIEIEYDFYKDKYWQSFDRFRNNLVL